MAGRLAGRIALVAVGRGCLDGAESKCIVNSVSNHSENVVDYTV